MRLRFTLFFCGTLATAGCSTYQVAKDVKLLSLTSEQRTPETSLGNIEGKSCQWTVFGWPLGETPSLRAAFENAAKQKDGGAIPGLSTKQDQDPAKLSVLRNVASENDFLGLYIVSRACVKVTGLGAR